MSHRQRSRAGLLNDVIENVQQIVLEVFNQDEVMADRPRQDQIYSLNPSQPDLKQMPVLGVWIPNMGSELITMGGNQGTFETTGEIGLDCRVQYMTNFVTDNQGADDLRHFAWTLYEHLNENRNINDLVRQSAVIQNINLEPQLEIVNGQTSVVSSVTYQLLLDKREKSKRATRPENSKYAP